METMIQSLAMSFAGRTRRNHALEHATLSILAQKRHPYRLAGHSDQDGCWIIGTVATEDLIAAATEARQRLQAGEHELAIHPNCGTNLVAAGVLAGTAAWLSMLGAGKSWHSKMERFPLVVSLVTMALVVAQPLGPALQKRVTTDAAIGDLRIVEVKRTIQGGVTMHRIVTASS